MDGGGTSDWHTVSSNSADFLSLSIHQLQPATRYQFMVVARSLETGDALFSSPVNATTEGKVKQSKVTGYSSSQHASPLRSSHANGITQC